MRNAPSIFKTLAIPLALGSPLNCTLLKSTPLFRAKTEQALKGTSACSGKNKALNKLVAQKKLKEKNPNDTRPILFTAEGNCTYAYFDESAAPTPPIVPKTTTVEAPKPPVPEATDSTLPPDGKTGDSG